MSELYPRIWLDPAEINQCCFFSSGTVILDGAVEYLSREEHEYLMQERVSQIMGAETKWEQIAMEWMRKYERLKDKYEPTILKSAFTRPKPPYVQVKNLNEVEFKKRLPKGES